MKYLIPVFVGVATITAAVTTALAQAHGAFNGRVALTPFLYGYGSAVILVVTAVVMAVRTSKQEKPTPHPTPVQHTEQGVTQQANPRQEQHVYIGGEFLRQLRENPKTAPEQDEKVPASGSPAGAVNVKLIPAIGPASVQLLEVKNLGSPQTFRADCTLLQRRNDVNRLHRSTLRMEWDHPSRRTSGKLPRGGSRNLIVAIADKMRGTDQGHPYEMEWIAITGLSGDYERKEIERTTWNYGDALPEYDLQITITSGDQEPHVECFTLRAGKTSAMEMFAIACEQDAERGNVVTSLDQAVRAPRSTNVLQRDWIGEWGESRRDFNQLEKSDAFAEFFEGTCAIRSDHNRLVRDQMAAACELAGSRLFHSPGITLSHPVQSQTEHWKRWLYFLKETEGLNRKVEVSGSNEDGYIEGLAHVSALACQKCAAKAFGSSPPDLPIAKPTIDTMRQEVLAVCKGVRVNMNEYVFVNTRIVSTVDAGIFKIWINVKTRSGKRYRGIRIVDLSAWLLVEEFFDERFSMTNSRSVSLETVALRTEHLVAGKPEKGWIGFEIPEDDIERNDRSIFGKIEELSLEIEDGMGIPHPLSFPPKESWPQTTDKIVHSSIRQR